MKTCLVVDDSKVIRMVARRILESLSFAISEAHDGRIALAACEQAMPDAVLLDWSMPVMDGVEFLRALRRMPGGDAPVVIFCAGETEPAKIEEAMASGANEYVMKPFDGDILESKLAQVGLLR